MSETRTSRRRLRLPAVDVAFDTLVTVAGLAVGVVATASWLGGMTDLRVEVVGAVALVYVLCQAPLQLPQRAGEAVIGFEVSALVFLTLIGPYDQALALWGAGQAFAQVTQRNRVWRSRMFNVGITGLSALSFVAVQRGFADAAPDVTPIVGVLLAGAAFFLTDLVVTAVSLALEARQPVHTAMTWRAVPLPLLIFVAVSTLGYLAAVLHDSQPPWVMLLLLVPVATILVSTDVINRSRSAGERMEALFAAAQNAPDWTDHPDIERALVEDASRVFRYSTVTVRDAPIEAGRFRASSPISLEGGQRRWLTVERPSSHGHYTEGDRGALDTLAAMATAAFARRRLHDQMSHLARHDVLTGLHNRAVFTDRLEHVLTARRPAEVAVLFCDLDGFKAVNDRFGHEAGDALLRGVAERLRGCMRVGDTLARLGGDEFAALLEDVVDPAEAEAVAQRVLHALDTPVQVGDRVIRVRTSIGIAHGVPGLSASDLMRNADTAMYRAKALGKNRAESFEPAMQAENLRRIEMQDELRRAMEQRALHFVMQPVVELATGRVDGFELLARWEHPRLGSVPPTVFVPLLEQMGLGYELAEQTLDAAGSAGRELAAAAGRPVTVAVNLFPAQATDPRVLQRVRSLRAEQPGLPLVIEITEGTLLGDDPQTVAAVDELAGTGAVLAVDDFGVGYSSISYLHRFRLSILKIDRTFVQSCGEPRTRPLLEGVVVMARTMGLVVVAEGIEDEATSALLRDLGCELGQGYHLSRPMPLCDALALVRSGTDQLVTT